MRPVIFFLVAACVWLAVDSARDSGRIASMRAYFGLDRIDDDAPNWGDVAGKIGELAAEREVLRQGIGQAGAQSTP